MKAVMLYVALLFFSATLNAQPKPALHLRISHALSRNSAESSSISSFRDTLKVLAVMVQFQTSNDARISGNGNFILQGDPNQIDPPPHDTLYFSYKMQFIQNYFKKVSNGKLTVVGKILDRVITVSKPMTAYSPLSGTSNRALAELASESWTLADSEFPGFPFNQYDVFVIFHAGVGHDINLVNLLGYDPSPLDLPSLYLSPQAFKDAFQDQSYAGIPVNPAGFRIDNSIILPETESQTFIGSQGTVDTIHISMNGLFAASIGSYLGLPDLWDTKTGASGIGQYGLEDGASFFAFFGLFPPEPSAWEKIYLGWVTPKIISSTTQNIAAPAVSLYHGGPTFFGQDTVYKIPINTKEYFLVENRSRDPLQDGQTLSIVQNGIIVHKTYFSDTAGFSNNDISGIAGSLLDVQDFDWAMPGLIDTTHVYDGGGIYIWHVDENVIDAGFATNTINADPSKKGISLEEAQGPQDIGQSYSFLQEGSLHVNGNIFGLDAWYLGNNSPVYANRFDRSSFPNSNSNSGAYSLITIKDFSARLARMTFTVQFGDNYLGPLAGFPKFLGGSASDKSVQNWSNGFYVSKGDSVYIFRGDGKSGTADTTGLLTSDGGTYLLACSGGSPTGYFAGARDSSLILIRVVDFNSDGVYDSIETKLVNVGHHITTPPSWSETDFVVGHANGGIVKVNPATKLVSDVVSGLSGPVLGVVFAADAVTTNGITDASNRTYTFAAPFAGHAVGHGNVMVLTDTIQRSVTILKNDLTLLGRASLAGWTGSISKPVVADIDRSGDEDVVMTIGNTLVAFNSRGFLMDGFPLKITGETGNASPPCLTSLEAGLSTDIVAVSSSGLVSAYTNRGRQLQGFPIGVGSAVTGSPATFSINGGTSPSQTGLALMANDGNLYGYDVAVTYTPVDSGPWVPLSTDFLPASRVYNWPNPVYGNSTQIRFFSAQDANVSIRIFDIAGRKITELSGRAMAGIDGEVTWDVSHIQTGIYLARVEASNQSQSQFRIVKIAVVK